MPGYSLDDQYNLCCTLLVLDWLSSGNNAEDTTTEEPTRQCTEEEAAKDAETQLVNSLVCVLVVVWALYIATPFEYPPPGYD